MRMYRFWIRKTGRKAYRWVLIAPNGMRIAQSLNEYTRASDAEEAVELLANCFGSSVYQTVITRASGKWDYLIRRTP